MAANGTYKGKTWVNYCVHPKAQRWICGPTRQWCERCGALRVVDHKGKVGWIQPIRILLGRRPGR